MSSIKEATPSTPRETATDSGDVPNNLPIEAEKAAPADDAKANIDGADDNGKKQQDETPKQEYMTGLPFIITFSSLMLAALLSALNASMVSTVSSFGCLLFYILRYSAF